MGADVEALEAKLKTLIERRDFDECAHIQKKIDDATQATGDVEKGKSVIRKDDKDKPRGRHAWADWYFKVGSIVFWESAVIAGIHLVNSLTLFWLNEKAAMKPRTEVGLPAILLMPLLHSSIPDLLSNMLIFNVLSTMLLLGKNPVQRFGSAVMMAWLVGGFILWGVGQDRVYRGLDIVNGCLFSFGIILGLIEKTFGAVFFAIACFIVYLIAIFELEWESVWEMELIGICTGAALAGMFGLAQSYERIEEEMEEEKQALIKKEESEKKKAARKGKGLCTIL